MEINIKTHDDFRRDHMTITLTGTNAEVRAIGERWTGGGRAGASLSDRLYTAEEVGDYQASEAELVATPLRARITELEAELERYRRAHVCTSDCKPNAHVAFIGNALVKEWERAAAAESDRADKAEDALIKVRAERETLEKTLAESRELVTFKTRVADDMDKDKETLFRKLQAERELVQEERTRANNLARRLAEAEQDRDNRLEELEAAERYQHERAQEARQSVAARDRLLAAATTRVRAAAEILGQKRVAEAADEIVTTKGAILADAVHNALAALSE